MTYIQIILRDEATGTLAELYNAEMRESGEIDNGLQAFSLRPDAYAAWGNLIVSIRSKMDLRRYELVTVAAASKLRCSY